jgi:hypothetical protein
VKINWGVGITISIVVFMLISIGFIYFAFNQDVNLVRDDYYEAEVQYNETMAKIKRTKELKDNLKISVVNNNIELLFPQIFSSNQINGNIFLYRPSTESKDKNLPINLNTSNKQTITTENLIPGMWKIKVDWNVDSASYLTEEIIMIQ